MTIQFFSHGAVIAVVVDNSDMMTNKSDNSSLLTIREQVAIARWMVHHHHSGSLKDLEGT